MKDEVDFLHADKNEYLLQINSMILKWTVKRSQSSQNNKFAIPLQYLKKEVINEVDFLHADQNQSFLQVCFNTLVNKQGETMGVIKRSKSTQSNNFAKPLQYLKKEVGDGHHFLYANKHQRLYKSALLFLMEVKDMSKVTKIGICNIFGIY